MIDLIAKFDVFTKQKNIENETRDNVLVMIRNHNALAKRMQKQFLQQNKQYLKQKEINE